MLITLSSLRMFIFTPLLIIFYPHLFVLMYRDYEKAYELETDEDALKDIKLKVKKVSIFFPQ